MDAAMTAMMHLARDLTAARCEIDRLRAQCDALNTAVSIAEKSPVNWIAFRTAVLEARALEEKP